MAHRRKSVRKIKETIRLHEAGFNKKQIAGMSQLRARQ